MSARVKITKEAVIDAGFEIVRESGEDKLTVRSIANRLGCSTQPVMYCYPKTEDLRTAILNKANTFHTKYLARSNEEDENILLYIGMNYMRFANLEKNLFRFIFLSDKNQGSEIAEIIDNPDILRLVSSNTGLSEKQSRDVFESLFISFHGYATLLAYSMLEYDEEHCRKQLSRIYSSVVKYIKKDESTEMIMT